MASLGGGGSLLPNVAAVAAAAAAGGGAMHAYHSGGASKTSLSQRKKEREANGSAVSLEGTKPQTQSQKKQQGGFGGFGGFGVNKRQEDAAATPTSARFPWSSRASARGTVVRGCTG
jgi:hypothetical protein